MSGCFTCTGLDCRGDLLRGLSNILRKGDYAEALQECATTPGPVARVAHAVILRHSRPRTELREIAEEAGQLRCQSSSAISRSSPPSPTALRCWAARYTIGIAQAFETIAAQSGYATAADIADGVYLSLLTSASSLAVAIRPSSPTVISQARVNALIMTWSARASRSWASSTRFRGANLRPPRETPAYSRPCPGVLYLAPGIQLALVLIVFLLISSSFLLQPGVAVHLPKSPFMLSRSAIRGSSPSRSSPFGDLL